MDESVHVTDSERGVNAKSLSYLEGAFLNRVLEVEADRVHYGLQKEGTIFESWIWDLGFGIWDLG